MPIITAELEETLTKEEQQQLMQDLYEAKTNQS
jgi:hypothetical protein